MTKQLNQFPSFLGLAQLNASIFYFFSCFPIEFMITSLLYCSSYSSPGWLNLLVHLFRTKDIYDIEQGNTQTHGSNFVPDNLQQFLMVFTTLSEGNIHKTWLRYFM